MKRDNGGPAYPRVEYHGPEATIAAVAGMTLLDYFAGQAMHGLLGNTAITEHQGFDRDRCVQEAYRYAEAMIAEKRRREREA